MTELDLPSYVFGSKPAGLQNEPLSLGAYGSDRSSDKNGFLEASGDFEIRLMADGLFERWRTGWPFDLTIASSTCGSLRRGRLQGGPIWSCASLKSPKASPLSEGVGAVPSPSFSVNRQFHMFNEFVSLFVLRLLIAA